jgi:lipopolysaccharide transport system ATP-binding protein
MGDLAISVKGVSKRYDVFENPRSRLIHAFWPAYREGMQEIWALRDIDFEVARGESVAVIGRNGGGKSTLLQILTGVLAPTSGEVAISGRISALLELGSGFNPEYTGRDNVVLNGMLLGLSREEILRRFDEIAAFAEIGEAIDRPVKTYSSGMLMRLAFAVQVLTDPDILIIDEALSVGDFFFQQKCFAHIRALCERGATLVFVSHDMGTVRDLCERAIYLREGRLQFAGETRKAIRDYLAERNPRALPDDPRRQAPEPAGADELESILRDSIWKATSGPAAGGRLIAVACYDAEGHPSTSFRLGTPMDVKVVYEPAADVPTHVTVLIINKYNQVVTSLGSSSMGLPPPSAEPGQAVVFEMRIDLLLETGNYSIRAGLGRLTAPNQGESIDSSAAIGPIAIQWDYEAETAPFLGMCGLPARAKFRTVADGA